MYLVKGSRECTGCIIPGYMNEDRLVFAYSAYKRYYHPTEVQWAYFPEDDPVDSSFIACKLEVLDVPS